MATEKNEVPTHRILSYDTPEHASRIKTAIEKFGVDVTIVSKSEDLSPYTKMKLQGNNVLMVFDVPYSVNTVEMFKRMSQCLEGT